MRIRRRMSFRKSGLYDGPYPDQSLAVLNGHERRIAVRNNTARWIGAFPETGWRDKITGETICFHGVDNGLGATVVSATDTEIEIDRPITEVTIQTTDI